MSVSKEQQIALSLCIGVALVAASLFYSDFSIRTHPAFASFFDYFETPITPQRLFASERHVYGNAKAKIVLVEFSDFECPYCAELHSTLKKIVDESEGAVAWEYRHLPLPIHSNAHEAALTAECVSELTNNATFWKYTEKLMTNQRQMNKSFLRETALGESINSDALDICLKDDDTQRKITDDVQTAVSLGGTGTPFTVIVYEDKTTKVISGALPYQQWIPLLQ